MIYLHPQADNHTNITQDDKTYICINEVFNIRYDKELHQAYIISLNNISEELKENKTVYIPSHIYLSNDEEPYQVNLPDNFWCLVKDNGIKLRFNIDEVINTNNVLLDVSFIKKVS